MPLNKETENQTKILPSVFKDFFDKIIFIWISGKLLLFTDIQYHLSINDHVPD